MKPARVWIIFDHILDVAAALAAAMIVFAMLAVCTEVGMRFFTGSPLGWVIDISSILLLYITFLSAAWLLKKERHVSMDLVITRLNPRHQFLLNIITSLIAAIVFAVITFYGAKSAWTHFQTGYWMAITLAIPKWPVTAIIPIGSFLLFIQCLRRAYGYLKGSSSLPADKIRGHEAEAEYMR